MGFVHCLITFYGICLILVRVGKEKIFGCGAIAWFRFINDFLCVFGLDLIEVNLPGLVDYNGGFDHLLFNSIVRLTFLIFYIYLCNLLSNGSFESSWLLWTVRNWSHQLLLNKLRRFEISFNDLKMVRWSLFMRASA